MTLRRPRVGDKVHDFRRVPHANGSILRLLYDDEGLANIVVKYDNGIEIYDVEEFEFNWTEAYGGTYILDKEP